MRDVYQDCPQFESEKYKIRFVGEQDVHDLWKVYSDQKAVPFFNSDNCGGDTFYYTTESRMREAVSYWLWEYGRRGFVRWSIVDQGKGEAIGTIELFHRKADDFFTNCGLLRLDIRSDYEKSEEVENILALIVEPAYELFFCEKLATKAIPEAEERILALKKLGFLPAPEKLAGDHDGVEYGDYFVRMRERGRTDR